MNNYKVSFYKNIADTTNKTVINIDAYLKGIKTGKYKKQIEALRNTGSKKLQTVLKKQLPNITASGIFSERKDASIITHSGLKQIDFDSVENLQTANAALQKDKYTFASFLSPTGTGIKLLVRIEPSQEKDVYKELEHYYKTNYNLQLDTSCSNVGRAMFVSYDEDLFHNSQSIPFETSVLQHQDHTNKNDVIGHSKLAKINDKQKEVELLIKKIEAQKTDITGDYKQWLNIGFALASEFGITGESYYQRLSSFAASYDATACKNQYAECCKARKAGTNINTLFAIAKNCNVLVYDGAQKEILKVKGKEKVKSNEIVFYNPIFKTDDEGNQVLKDIKINYVKFTELIYSFGYRRFDIDTDFIYVKLQSNVITQVTKLKIQDCFFEYLETLPNELSNGITKKVLKEKMFNNPQNFFCDNRLSLLKNNEPFIFNEDTKTECFIYYKNGFVSCTKDGYKLNNYSTLRGFIWDTQIIDRDFTYLNIESNTIKEMSVYAQFLFNVSAKHKDNFDSLCSLIGYLLHGYTDVKLKAIILTDSRISEEANGRTGKTLFGSTLKHIKRLTQINGKDFDPTNKNKYQEANLDTQIIFLNDVRSHFKFEVLYNDITEGITVEKKNKNPFTVKAKMCITTNKTIAIEGSSSKDRSIEFEFADHYSEKFSPEDEFKQRFFFGLE
jgi:VirE N-terminal domain/Primase C terminal 2 (PriCT-2)